MMEIIFMAIYNYYAIILFMEFILLNSEKKRF
jgi:hypothetical protein